MRTTALILAGGAGRRLVPRARPYEKPLFPVDERPLVLHSLEFARAFGVDKTVVIVNPVVKKTVRTYLLGNETTITQDEPRGVSDAVRVGLPYVEGSDGHLGPILLLLADNTYAPDGHWFRERVNDRESAIAVNVRTDETGRFSRFDRGVLERRRVDHRKRPRWIGPVWLPRVSEVNVRLIKQLPIDEPIESILNCAGAYFTPVEMACRDRGVALEMDA